MIAHKLQPDKLKDATLQLGAGDTPEQLKERQRRLVKHVPEGRPE